MNELQALNPLDGRYQKQTEELRDIFSESGLIRSRIFVETQWFKFLAQELKLFALSAEEAAGLDQIPAKLTVDDAAAVKEIERTTNHDVKAAEYFLKEQLAGLGLGDRQEWVHFACTSADINNTSYALMVKKGRACLLKHFKEVLKQCEDLGQTHRNVPMMSRTHGQPATPTTAGKEFINFAWRLRRDMQVLNALPVEGKFNGATGNFNAHCCAFPDVDWIGASQVFLAEYLDVAPLLLTTQINPNSYIAQILHCLGRLSSIVIDLNRDMWGYISLGYFKQRVKAGEVGSSTMPHKVNPIDFENSEGNLGLAIALINHLSVKLLNSRFQRDLTDSTVMRNLGSVFGYILLALKSTQKGLGKIDIDAAAMAADLDSNWELLAEAVQTVMRVYGEEHPYEKLKELTRGRRIGKAEMADFIDGLQKVPPEVKERLKDLTPAGYTGLAAQLVDSYFTARQ